MQISDGEWKVMNVLWAESPASARDVQEAVAEETDWAYTTVKTMLTRLVEKGALRERRVGNRSLYEPLVSQDEARGSAVRSLLDKAFEGTFGSLFHYLVDDRKLSRKERKALQEMLEKSKASRS